MRVLSIGFMENKEMMMMMMMMMYKKKLIFHFGKYGNV
jgi:hypothetical protein